MSHIDIAQRLRRIQDWILNLVPRGRVQPITLTITLACVIGVLGGVGAAAFTWLIEFVSSWTVELVLAFASGNFLWRLLLLPVPALGLLLVSWFTRRYAPEAQGHGVPEVILAVAREDGIIRSRVSLVKILASGICIGTGGSIGREGPIVQIGSSLGSAAGQLFKLSARNIKVLVACGAAAGISATFNAPLAGVIFASEIILGNFAVESLTPIVAASVLADVVQKHIGEHGQSPAFKQLHYEYLGAPGELPAFFALGLLCGIAAVFFTKLLYFLEDTGERVFKRWWIRALVAGGLLGLAGVLYPAQPPSQSGVAEQQARDDHFTLPPLFGVGYDVVDHSLHLENEAKSVDDIPLDAPPAQDHHRHYIRLDRSSMVAELWWLLPLMFLKPLFTSLTLAGGGSGGIFAPSLFLGATLGASFGLLANLFAPALSAHPGVYAIVGMGAVVSGTTHGVLSAILIVYEMTNDYRIILPIMIAAGLSSVVARLIDRESIYHKKLSRRGQSVARGHDLAVLEHIMARDLMVRRFPTIKHTDTLTEIIRVARANPQFESLPVMGADGKLRGIIRPEDLHRVVDSDMPPQLVFADDIALHSPISVSPDENMLEVLRDFGSRDVETLPVEVGKSGSRRLVGLLLRSDVMRCYREELLRNQ